MHWPLPTATVAPLDILHTENSHAWGGQEVRILTESVGMLERGHRVALAACPGSPIEVAARKMGIPVYPIDIGGKRVGPLLNLRRLLADPRRRYDIINTHSSTDSWLTAIAGTTLRDLPPIVRTRHVSTTINDRRSTRWLYLKATAHIVTTGEALRVQLHRDNGIPLAHMTSVRTGIDLQRYRPSVKQEARAALGVPDLPTLGIVATLRSWKGHAYLLEAFALLREYFPTWQLLLIGDGPQRAALEGLARSLRLGNAIRFVGNVDNVPEWLSTLDLFALPSYGDEGVPQGIMQAMACGVPVVSTGVGAIREAVQEDVTGLIVQPRDPTDLAAALGRLMGDETLRNAMGRAGLNYAGAHFGIAAMVDRMEAVFDRHARRALATHAGPAQHGPLVTQVR